MIRSTFERRVNIDLQTQINELSNVIHNKLYLINDKTLHDTIIKDLKSNKLSLNQLKTLNSFI